MNSFAASAHARHICLLEFAIVLKLKNKENPSAEMQQLQLNQTAKQSVFLRIQVRTSSQTKGLERR